MGRAQRFVLGRAGLVFGLASLVAGIPIVWIRIAWESRSPYGDPNYAIWEMLVNVVLADLREPLEVLARENQVIAPGCGPASGRQDMFSGQISHSRWCSECSVSFWLQDIHSSLLIVPNSTSKMPLQSP